ncbi:hypothetical protein GCM10009765_61790 [Fodinicola feengrottensis]|uniref:Uncharacterized protein n=1 Tax=Fodinicola feengrottensis TaxID=435914 RepID=A0ABN2IG99_9ACTN
MTAPHSPDRDDETQPKPSIKARLDLSFTQVIAGALAAVTSAVAASYFGVAGTLIGAGFGSVIITVGTSVYKASLRRTNETLRKVIPVQAISQLRVVPDDTTVVRSGGPEPTTDPARLGPPPPRPPRPSTVPGAGAARPADETTLMKKVSDSTIGFGQGGEGTAQLRPTAGPIRATARVEGSDLAQQSTPQVESAPARWLDLLRQLRWGRVAVLAALVFALGTGVVVGVELVGGGSLTSILHGKPDGGTSIGGGSGTPKRGSDREPGGGSSGTPSPHPSPSIGPSSPVTPSPSAKPTPSPSAPPPTKEPTAPPSKPADQSSAEPTPPA